MVARPRHSTEHTACIGKTDTDIPGCTCPDLAYQLTTRLRTGEVYQKAFWCFCCDGSIDITGWSTYSLNPPKP